MALIKLSEEEKDKLLKESDAKMQVKELKAETRADLWTFDLDNFLVELEKQEKRAENEIDASLKQAMKKKPKEAASGRGRKKEVVVLNEIHPHCNGIRVEPTMAAMKEKYEPKAPRIKAAAPKEAEAAAPKKAAASKKGAASKKAAASKRAAKKKKKDSSEEELEDDDVLSASSSDEDAGPAPKRDARGRGAAPKKFQDEMFDSDDDDDFAFAKSKKGGKKNVIESDSDDYEMSD